MGVDLLQQQSRSSVLPTVRRNSSPLVATLLSFVPGLGAAYNGQTAKALVHFAIFASFFQMAILTDGLPIFVFGFFGIWLYAAVDAYRTSQLFRAGLALDAEQDVIARRMYGNPLGWSITLMMLGAIFLLHTLVGIQLPVRQVLPVLLVILGAYMLLDYLLYQRRRKPYAPAFDANSTAQPVPPGTSLDSGKFQTGELVAHVTTRNTAPLPFEQRP
jgi:hypothetical protein